MLKKKSSLLVTSRLFLFIGEIDLVLTASLLIPLILLGLLVRRLL